LRLVADRLYLTYLQEWVMPLGGGRWSLAWAGMMWGMAMLVLSLSILLLMSIFFVFLYFGVLLLVLL
jgi:hypothetical protein